MKVAVVTGVLAFLGAITGSYVVAHFEQQRSDTQFKREFRVHILDKRLAVFEQCTHAWSQLTRAKVLKEYQDAMLKKANSDTALNLAFQKSGPPEVLLEIQREMNAIGSEYASCVESSSTLFGPKTNMAADALKSADVSDPNDSRFTALFNGMVEEATYYGEKNSH